jgi:hypothetical protein
VVLPATAAQVQPCARLSTEGKEIMFRNSVHNIKRAHHISISSGTKRNTGGIWMKYRITER